jgi:choline transport protein
VLAPPQYSKFLSYLTGWTTLIAWQAVVASAAFLGGAMIQGLLTLNYPSYEGKPWQVTLLFYAVLLLTLFINTYLAKLLPKIESMVLVVHVLGFFVILIPLVYLAPNKASAKEVFTTFTNSGGFSSMGLSFFVGMSGAMFAFIGTYNRHMRTAHKS